MHDDDEYKCEVTITMHQALDLLTVVGPGKGKWMVAWDGIF